MKLKKKEKGGAAEEGGGKVKGEGATILAWRRQQGRYFVNQIILEHKLPVNIAHGRVDESSKKFL